MTAITTPPAAPARPDAGHRTTAGLVALVAGAVLIASGRLLTTPGGNTAQRLEQMSGHDLQVSASALLTILGFAALVPGLLTVAAQVRGRGALLATVGSGLVVLGGVGMSVLAAVDLTTLAATHAGPTSAMRDLLHEMDTSPGILALTPLAVIGYLVGPFLIALAARRAGLLPRWLPWATLIVLILQPVAAGSGGPGLARVVDSVFQIALVAIFVILARTLARPGPHGDPEAPVTLSACGRPSS